jgi:hypothetical protein
VKTMNNESTTRPRPRNTKRSVLWLAATGMLVLAVLLLLPTTSASTTTTYKDHDDSWNTEFFVNGVSETSVAKYFTVPAGSFYGSTTVQLSMDAKASGCSPSYVVAHHQIVVNANFVGGYFDVCQVWSTTGHSTYTVNVPASYFYNGGSQNSISVMDNGFDATYNNVYFGVDTDNDQDHSHPNISGEFVWTLAVTHYAPSVPQGVSTACASNGATISWSAPAFGESPTGYRVYYGTTNPPTYYNEVYSTTWTHVPTWSATPTYYQVSAFNNDGEGAKSPVISKAPCDQVLPTVTGNPAAIPWTKTASVSGVTWGDAYSGLKASGAQYSVGTTSGATDVSLGWNAMPAQPSNGASTWSPSWSPTTLAQGMNYVNTKIQDQAGNSRDNNGAYTIQYDTGLPTVTSPLTWTWRNTIPTFTGVSWTDSVSGLALAEYSIGSAGGLTNIQGWDDLPVQPSGQTTAWNPSWSPPALAQGTNHINMRVTDVAGNVLTTNSVYQVQYDTVLPGLPTIASTSHADPARYYQATTFSGNAQASDNPGASGMSGIYRYLTTSATCPASLDGVGTFVSGSPIGASYGGLGPFEERSFCAQAKDNAGNLGAVARHQVNVNTIAPTITFVEPTGITADANAVVGGHYNADKGNLDPFSTKTNVDPAAVHLTIDGSIDVVTFWMATPICAPIWTSACPVTVDSSHVEYRPVAPWTNGVHSVLLGIGDTTLPAVTASQAWTFTEATVASCPPGTTGTVIQGIPVCVSTGPCPSGTIGMVIQTQQVCVPIPTTCDGGEVGAEAGETELCEPNPCPTPVGPAGPGELAKVCGIGVPDALPGDEDADNVPDNQEAALCSRENPNILSDGHCTGDDYTLPTWSDVVSDVIWLATGTRP